MQKGDEWFQQIAIAALNSHNDKMASKGGTQRSRIWGANDASAKAKKEDDPPKNAQPLRRQSYDEQQMLQHIMQQPGVVVRGRQVHPARVDKPQTMVDNTSAIRPGAASVRSIYRDLESHDESTKMGPNAPQPWSNSYLWQQGGGAPRRPMSRANSEMGQSRYQSYCTLPRPDIYFGSTIDGGVDFPATLDAHDLDPTLKAKADVAAQHEAMARQQLEKDMLAQQQMEAQYALQHMHEGGSSIEGGRRFGWTLSMAWLSLLVGCAILGVGIARLLLNAKWAVGIDVVFGAYLIITSLCGIVGGQTRHYGATVAFCVASLLSTVLALIPFLNGIIVLVPDSYPRLDRRLFVADAEPIELDLVLAGLCVVQIVLGIVTSTLSCCALGQVLQRVEGEEEHKGESELSTKLTTTHDDTAPIIAKRV